MLWYVHFSRYFFFLKMNTQEIKLKLFHVILLYFTRGESRAAVTSKMERFVIIVNGWKPLTIITKRSILDVTYMLLMALFRFDYQILCAILIWVPLQNMQFCYMLHCIFLKKTIITFENAA